PDGAGSITFEGVQEWASFQITEQPASGWALTGAVAAIAGLAGSLFIQRRRVWVRAVRGADGVTVVEMAGLGRSESAKLPEELADLAGTLFESAPPEPDAEPGTGSDSSSEPDSDSDSVEESSEEPAEGAEK
ncbi:cytochrome c biogenesis protein ResB, partial [Streptomyces mirabilis]